MATSKTPRAAAVKQVATFGAALGTLAVAAPTEGAIINLSILHSQTVPFGDEGSLIGFDTAGNHVLAQWNTLAPYGKAISSGEYGNGFDGLVLAARSSVLTTDRAWNSFLYFPQSSTGTRFVGFRDDLGHLGWFQLDLGEAQGTIHYLAGAYNTIPGAPIHVPEPASTTLAALGLLALGARGVRRLREQRKQQADSAAL